MEIITTLDPDKFIRLPLKQVQRDCEATRTLNRILAKMPFLSLEAGPFVAGGSLVRSLVGSNSFSDVDLFCCTTQSFAETHARLMVLGADEGEWPASMGEVGPEDNAISQVDLMNYTLDDVPIQLIDIERQAVAGSTPKQLLLGFDITAAMVATDGENLLIHREALIAISKSAVVVNWSVHREALIESRPRLGDKDKCDKRIVKYQELLTGKKNVDIDGFGA